MGGLGNQMFQIAKAHAEGIRTNGEVKFFLPKSVFWDYINPLSKYHTILRNCRFSFKTFDANKIIENQFTYAPLEAKGGNTLFWGYFQSNKHFKGFERQIRSIFSIPILIKGYFKFKYPSVFHDHSISIHIRRGDFLKYPEIHSTLALEYYIKSLEKIPKKGPIFLFSDDMNWVKSSWPNLDAIYVNEKFDYMELWLMSLCQHHILSNSTFSWWAYFLSERKNAVTVAPSLWFGPKGEDAKDLYQEDWLLTQVKYQDGKLILDE